MYRKRTNNIAHRKKNGTWRSTIKTIAFTQATPHSDNETFNQTTR